METPHFLIAVSALALGALLAWLLAASRNARTAALHAAAQSQFQAERERRLAAEQALAGERQALAVLDRELAVARERVAQAERLAAEQRDFVEQARRDLENSFQALAATALRGNTEEFLALAEQKWQAGRAAATNDLDERRSAIELLLQPLRDTLGRLDQRTGEIERARIDAYSRMDEHLKVLAEQTAALRDKTGSLSNLLRGSQTGGRWGEVLLRNVAEMAGMAEHCDFAEQETQSDGSRPDMVVKLPGGRSIAVDSKAPLNAYVEASDATSDGVRRDALQRHARALRLHVKTLAERDYASSLGGPVDLVVLFLPGDSLLAAAFGEDPDLQVAAFRAKVLIATPTTLVALLRTVAIYWQQTELAENAERILDAARLLYERAVVFEEHLGAVGKGLGGAVGAFNRAVASFETRLMPAARRLEELKVGAGAQRQLFELEPIEETPRKLGE
jgi:DNA recombination protein RmuC